MRCLLVLFLAAATLPIAVADPNFDSAKLKMELIEKEQYPAGTTVRLSLAEVNAYARGRAAEEAGEGIRDVNVKLGDTTVVWSAIVNFAKLPQTEGLASNWLFGAILSGEKPVTVAARLISGGGMATVEVDNVEISGTTFEGNTLDFLVQQLVGIIDSDIEIGEPYELDHNVERIAVTPTGVNIKIAD